MEDNKCFFHEVDGCKIPVILSRANNENNNRHEPLLIMCHGISTDKNEYLNFLVTMEKSLNEVGVSTLRFDFRGHGESNLSPSHFSISSQIFDLFNVIHWVKDKIPNSRISLFGISFGAPPCIMIDRWLGNEVLGKRFLLAPVLDYNRTFLNPETAWGRENFSPERQMDAMRGNPVYLNDDFYMTGRLFSEMASINILSNFLLCKGTVSIFHGDEDDMVPIDISRDISRAVQRAELTSFGGMEHGFTAKGDETGKSKETLRNVGKMVSLIESGIKNGC
ncbi:MULTISPECIES: alpha/beta fold hydrolase [unclassified Thalassospira]|uniref:alpha/beta hydrolase family protein n=1 Tax=unclassified Thalassospira TaxID=2648997 RepID=UPI0007A61674|nr:MULTISPECIES: alpha/beta fold hydrolase [unclassified Thalassospira]KZC99926.1 hypothetical protein AUQ41_09735 [Thalassospira sp. MCCC 1A02898]ONH86106.1 hypothetical protein TH47_17965 [Thalassospira sp. MCCC 1A02803]